MECILEVKNQVVTDEKFQPYKLIFSMKIVKKMIGGGFVVQQGSPSGVIWTHEATFLFLTLYETHKPLVEQGRIKILKNVGEKFSLTFLLSEYGKENGREGVYFVHVYKSKNKIVTKLD